MEVTQNPPKCLTLCPSKNRRKEWERRFCGQTCVAQVSYQMVGVSKEGVQWRTIKKAVIHQGFQFPDNDIALAFLDAPWNYTETVVPIALAKTSMDNLGECFVAGYGKTGHGDKDKTSPVLLMAKVVTISRRRCSKMWGMSMDTFVCSISLPRQGGDPSQGDSGGPLWCERRSVRELTGIVSGKNFDQTTIYTRVSEYIDWIQSDGRNGQTPLSNIATKYLIFLCSFTCVMLFLV
ncbi:trypsin domain-containing protein [Phthorimaea operculella]|nr:trypsin domain-containing protein [Phthorimaea operculella]